MGRLRQLSPDEIARLEAAGVEYPWSVWQSLALVDGGAQPFDKRCADRMAAAVDIMVYTGLLDARSPVADARLDYGEPLTLTEARRVFDGGR